MIFQVIIITITLLFSQGKCRTYIPEKYTVEHNPNLQQTYQATYNPIEQQRRIVYVGKGQHPNGWNENIMKDDRSPIIFTDNAPITINYNGNSEQWPYGFRNSFPIVMKSQDKITMNYDGLQDDDISPCNQDICLLSKTMVELPSGIVMPYLKFKNISSYLSEDQKTDIRIILYNKNMTYKQFQETLWYYGCDDLGDSQQPSKANLTNYVTLANGTQVETDEYRNIVSSITSGSETLMVPNVVNGKYSLYRSLIADELPELIPSAFVITHAGIVVSFSLYYAVDTEHFQRPPAAVVPRIRQIKWRDGKLVNVQIIRHVIDALKTPAIISFVFPNKKRVPFVQCNVKESTELYDYDPEKVVVDVGQCKSILLSHFNDILFAMHIPDDSGDGKYKRFNPPVFAWDPKCMNTATGIQPNGKVCNKSNEVDDRNHSGYSIHVINKDKRQSDDKPSNKQLTVFGPVSAMKKTSDLDSNDTIRIILTSPSGTNEIKITNVLNNKKPLIYDLTDKPINVTDLKNDIISQNECDYSPILINKTNISSVSNTMNPQNNNCTNVLKSCLNESTKNQTAETVITTIVTQNTTELTNTSTNLNTSGTINDTTIENENNATKTPVCTEKFTKDEQNDCSPVIGDNEIPITKNTDKNQTEIKNITVIKQTLAENVICSNNTHTDKKFEPNNTKNNTATTETRNNTATNPNNYENNSNPVTEFKNTPTMNDSNQNQTEIKNITTSPDNKKNTIRSNTTNTDKTYEPNKTNENTLTTEARNDTAPNPKNNQNNSNPIIEGNITKNINNHTETKNTTVTVSAPNASTIDSNNAHKKYEHVRTDNDTVTTETRDITDLNQTAVLTENSQDGSNPVIETNEIAAIANTDDYGNPVETISTTGSTPNHTKNTNASNLSRIDGSIYTGSDKTPDVLNTAETIQTPEAAIAFDADDVGPTENPDTIPETTTGIDDNELADVNNITTTGMVKPSQPTPIYTETIKTPNNGSVTNNATKIVNIVVY